MNADDVVVKLAELAGLKTQGTLRERANTFRRVVGLPIDFSQDPADREARLEREREEQKIREARERELNERPEAVEARRDAELKAIRHRLWGFRNNPEHVEAVKLRARLAELEPDAELPWMGAAVEEL